jgi:multimeric flavodoxin WrbA
MRVLVLVGSHRKGGNTAAVARRFMERLERALQELGVRLEADFVWLGDCDIRPCKGCRLCFDKGEEFCPQNDAVLEIHRRILAADGVVLASPVYVNDVSGTMKTLIDRLAFVCHRPAYFGRLAYPLVTSGGTPTRHTLRTLQSAFVSWGGELAGRAGVITGAWMEPHEIGARYGARLRRAARSFARALVRRSSGEPGWLALVVFRVQQRAWSRAHADTLDYRYWRDRGWTDPSRSYFTPRRGHRLKTIIARLLGEILGRIVSRDSDD